MNIPALLPKIVLPHNDVGVNFRAAINQQARQSPIGGYILPHRSNFPVVDSVFASSTSMVPFQMKAGRSKRLSDTYDFDILSVVGNVIVCVFPDDVTLTMKLKGGPAALRRYRFILNEEDSEV